MTPEGVQHLSHTPSASGSYGRQAVRRNTGRFKNS